MSNQKEHIYRVVASTPTRHSYPGYKIKNNPETWHCNGNVFVTCKDGKVDVRIYEEGTILEHNLSVYSEDGPVNVRLTEQFHVEE